MSEPTLGDGDRRFLLRLARATLDQRLAGGPAPPGPPDTGPVTEVRGAFVTLRAHGDLRGCIGHVVGTVPLWQSVRDNAVNAALRDPRFAPVAAAELPSLAIEISALTPLRPATSAAEVEVGRHGLMVERGPCRGLLLPQVATEWGWDRDAFLAHTCRKAGLPGDAWRSPDARLWLFEAEVFSEDALGLGPAAS